ncbi:hypothetical protein L227DRAFT_172055 [Lentinus tigrinus ALCF2SS1-6]|uniref:Uncharacterized protein n=1 Tax=Lentinus tigrinus ALCF2SS1-6 TaxID=1328759 RepID=A0A5C2S5T7_9APHY|nr:hypothetical protein L227DRAFT_172055 [Lentinus tigrinus ALCF2SS1-6]
MPWNADNNLTRFRRRPSRQLSLAQVHAAWRREADVRASWVSMLFGVQIPSEGKAPYYSCLSRSNGEHSLRNHMHAYIDSGDRQRWGGRLLRRIAV